MKYIKKIICTLLAAALFFSSAAARTIYEDITTKDITRGVTHTYIEKIVDGYWQKINVITADLSDKNVEMTSLFDSRGVSYKSKLSSLAASGGAVAAINADFFDTTTPSGRTTPLGLTVADGEIVSSASHDTGLAAFVESEKGVMAGYFQTEIYLHADNGNKMQILHINKYHSTNSIVLFTKDFGANTPQNTDGSVEMTIINNKVTEIVSREEGTPIPENGCVLKVNPAVNNFFAENFQVGDNAEITVEISPDAGKIKSAVGGGTVLVKEGKVAEFTHNISGSNPRSSAGISKDGDTLYLVTVEGREGSTPGMTQTALANLMISLGAYDAINFDGGGSTEMVVRDNQSGAITVANTPSDGSERYISTALGVKSVGENPYFASMTLSASKENVCVGDWVEIWASPFDNYKNPTVIGNDITFSADDGGEFAGNRYYPKTPGVRTVTATCQGVSATIKINVLQNITNLTFYPATFTGNSGYLSVVAADDNGFKSQISPDSVGWRVESGSGSVSGGNVTADGRVEISATFGDKIIKTTINGSGASYKIFDKFESSIKNPDFVIMPSLLEENTMLNTVINAKISDRATSSGIAFSAGSAPTSSESLTSLSQKSVKNTKVITVRNDLSLNKAYDTWQNFLNLESAEENNILIYLAGGNKFSDESEQRMFDKTLKKLYNLGKNVFVISPGDETSVDISDGTRYITFKKYPAISLSDFTKTFDSAVYLKFKVSGNNLLYEVSKLF